MKRGACPDIERRLPGDGHRLPGTRSDGIGTKNDIGNKSHSKILKIYN
jgi:hypothetical protein